MFRENDPIWCIVTIIRSLRGGSMRCERNRFVLFLIYSVFFIVQVHGQIASDATTYGAPVAGSPYGQSYSPVPTPVPVAPVASASRMPFGIQLASSSSMLMPFNPLLDNHLKAPTSRIGLFGLQVSAVERTLRSYGAKPYSYSFGKYSRMTFSVYMLTMFFDRDRRLGSILIEPRPPFNKVEPQAQTFFLKLFLEGEEMSRFKTVISSDKMEISFSEDPSPKVSPKGTPKDAVATKSRSL